MGAPFLFHPIPGRCQTVDTVLVIAVGICREPVMEQKSTKRVLAFLRFVVQSARMESNWAAEHLQVIRTLMERSALYRRALAPIMIFAGSAGVIAAAIGCGAHVASGRAFALYWLAVAAVTLAGVSLLVRRQALKGGEPFWSLPTRRVTQAAALPLAAGLVFSVVLLLLGLGHMRWLFIFPNLFFYACALHAAGFFMSRGIRLFAWGLMGLGGLSLLVIPGFQTEPNPVVDHAVMGGFFGILHLAYGIYLYFTEPRGNET